MSNTKYWKKTNLISEEKTIRKWTHESKQQSSQRGVHNVNCGTGTYETSQEAEQNEGHQHAEEKSTHHREIILGLQSEHSQGHGDGRCYAHSHQHLITAVKAEKTYTNMIQWLIIQKGKVQVNVTVDTVSLQYNVQIKQRP